MRESFSNGFKLFASRALSAHSPTRLAVISSTAVTSIFAAIMGPCKSWAISLTGDLDLYERMLYYILQHNTSFPNLKEIFYHCSPPLSYSTCYTYCYIPSSFQPPVHLPISFRTVDIYLTIPISSRGGKVTDTGYYHVTWNLHRPDRSTVYTGPGESSVI